MKSKGAVTASKKQSNKAAKRAQAPAALQQDLVGTEQELTGDEALTDPLQCMANHIGQHDGYETFAKGAMDKANWQSSHQSVATRARKKEGQTSGLPCPEPRLR